MVVYHYNILKYETHSWYSIPLFRSNRIWHFFPTFTFSQYFITLPPLLPAKKWLQIIQKIRKQTLRALRVSFGVVLSYFFVSVMSFINLNPCNLSKSSQILWTKRRTKRLTGWRVRCLATWHYYKWWNTQSNNSSSTNIK